MKKILRLVTTSVLTLTLVACGGNSSSSQSTSTSASTSTGPQSTSTTSSYAAVSSITLSAAAETLEQVSTSLQKVTVSATLNSGVNPAQELEWYVNGTKSSQTGKSFEYTPTAVGEYAIVAKVGSVSSNTVTVKVAAQGLEIESVKFISNKILEIKGSDGASVAIEGKTIIDSSYYDLVNDLYHIELKEAIAQGSSVKITLSKDGATSTKEELYETRVFAVNAVSNAVANADGSYTVTKPYAAAGEASFSYQITTKTDNIIGTYLSTKIHTEVPEGATAINDTTKLVTLKDEDAGPSASFSVTKSTVIGDYTHTITLGEKSISIIVHVVEPEAIVGQKAKVYTDDDATTVALEKFDLAYGLYTEAATAGVQIAELGASGFGVAAETDGSYSITKPYETNTSSYAFLFTFYGEYLEAPEYVNNNYTISLTGPSAYGGEKATLTSGIETSSTGTSDALNDDCLDMYKDITANSGTSFTREVYQVINKDTPVGTYTFTLTVKTEKGETYTKDVVINIKDPVASLTSKLGSANLASYEIITTPIAYVDAEGTTYQIGDYVLQSTKYYRCKVAGTTGTFASEKWTELTTEAYSSTQIAVLNDAVIESSYDKDTNTYTIEKPMLASSLYKYDFSVILKNLQSTVASDEEMTADQIANYSNISFQGKVFNLSSTATQSGYKKLGTLNTSLDAYRGIKEYDATATYASNEFVIHDGSYFKCPTAISPAEPWNVDHWAAATTAEAQSIADAIAYDAANIQIYGTDVETQAQSNRVFANYTYTAVSEETGTSTTSGKAAIQLKNAVAADAEVSVSLIKNFTNSILSSTVAGSYSYTYEIEIGGKTYSTVLNVVVKNPEAKLFVLADATTSSGAKYQYLYVGTTALAPKADGDYYIDVPSADTTLKGTIGIADLANGTYTYSVSKQYPDSSKNIDVSGQVKISASNGAGYASTIAEVTSGDVPYATAWKIDDTIKANVKGNYEYTFVMNGVSKTITVHVGDYKAKLVVDSASVEGTKLETFGSKGYYLFDGSAITEAQDVDITLSSVNIVAGTELWVIAAATNPALADKMIEGNTNVTKVTFDENGEFVYTIAGLIKVPGSGDNKHAVATTKVYVYTRSATDASKFALLTNGVNDYSIVINVADLDADGQIVA